MRRSDGPDPEGFGDPGEAVSAGTVAMPVRIAIGLGDASREREVLPGLMESGEFVIVDRCLAWDQLLASLRSGAVDAALVSWDLHRLDSRALEELGRVDLPLVLLTRDANEPRWSAFPGVVLPLDAGLDVVRGALLAAVRGERAPRRASEPSDGLLASAVEPRVVVSETGSPIAVAGGPGSPGRTTVALNLAAALGSVAPTVLVDADLSAPSLVAHLGADPTRNLVMLAHAEPETPAEWERALDREVQPLASRSPHGMFLAGLPKPGVGTSMSTRFLDRLIVELSRRYRYVIVDIGADLIGAAVPAHRAALTRSRHVLLVATPDLVGLWRARRTLAVLATDVQIRGDRVAVVINRHDRRYHHGRREIDWELGLPAAAVIPYDHGAVQRALAAEEPLIVAGRSPAAHALLALAERVVGGRIGAAGALQEDGESSWQRWLARTHVRWPWVAHGGQSEREVSTDGDSATAA